TVGATEQVTFGYIEVEVGPLSEGRPLQQMQDVNPVETEEQPQPDQPRPEQPASPPETAKRVHLAEVSEETEDEPVATPATEPLSPVTESAPTESRRDDPAPSRNPVVPLGGGTPDGTTGSTRGTQGEGSQDQKAAPFSIEGLNRTLVYGPLPEYADK